MFITTFIVFICFLLAALVPDGASVAVAEETVSVKYLIIISHLFALLGMILLHPILTHFLFECVRFPSLAEQYVARAHIRGGFATPIAKLDKRLLQLVRIRLLQHVEEVRASLKLGRLRRRVDLLQEIHEAWTACCFAFHSYLAIANYW